MKKEMKITDNATKIIEKQKELLDAANPALRNKIDWVISWYKKDSRNSLMSRWDLGVQINEVLEDNKSGSKKYGPKAINTISIFAGEAESSLYVCANLAATYSKVQMEEISEMVMADDITPLSFGHMRAIIFIDSSAERQKAINLTLENCWTCAQLAKYIAKKVNKVSSGNNPNGRPVSKPKTLNAVIDQQLSFADDYEKRDTQVWSDPKFSVDGYMEELDTEAYTEELADKLSELAYRMRQLADNAADKADEYERKYEEVRKALDTRYKDGAKMIANTSSITEEESEDSQLLPAL